MINIIIINLMSRNQSINIHRVRDSGYNCGSPNPATPKIKTHILLLIVNLLILKDIICKIKLKILT